ncbi:glycoside hydrolase family 18 protein, partial [Plenodomus tracheiphilus IPT5]
MRWLLPLSVALWLAIFGSASSAAQSQSNLTYFGAPRLSLTGVTPTLDITEGYILAQTNTSVSTLSSSAHCSAANPCVDGSCCNSNGLCGYRPEHCRLSSPVTCVANCNATAPCGEFSAGGSTTCPLNLCCSYFGFCGASEPFCNAQVHTQTGLDAPCQGNCGGTQIPSCGKESGTASRRIAYYETWNSRRRDCDKVMPNQLDTTGLTHLVLAFASIDPKTYEVRPLNPADEAIYDQLLALPGSYRRIIGVGGWEFSDPGATRYTWSNMTSKQENRNAFIESFQQFISKWKFTGIDIDWEWPGSSDRGGNAADKENQVAFVAELRKAMGSDFTISVVIPAQYDYLKNMDPTGLEAQVDWLNILAYDLHGAWDANVNGLGPYIKPHTDLKEIDSALELLWSANVTPKNVVMGLANYGRGYIAKNKDCMWYGCKFTGPSRAGECTKQEGVLSTCEIHRIINQHGLKPKIVEGGAGIKEIAWDDQWVGYDDDETFDLKLKLANDRCLGGTALWAIDYATCGGDGGSPSAGNSVAPAPPVATSIKSTASAILPAPSSQIFTTASSATLPPPQLQSSVAFSGAPGTSATHSGDVSIP